MAAGVVDSVYFQDLAAANPSDVCRRAAGSVYDPATGRYSVTVWGSRYAVDPAGGRIMQVFPEGSRESWEDHPYLALFVMYYLLQSRDIPPENVWISEKDLPGGPTFFRGPHEIPTRLITDRVGNDPAVFTALGQRWGGSRLHLADAGVAFAIVPKIPVAVLFWQGDDVFPSESRILYDKTISQHLTLDIIYALAVSVCHRLGCC